MTFATARNNITYFATKKEFPFFFSENLIEVVEDLHRALPRLAISIYPDATLKTNGLPTGILCASPEEETVLLPYVLRDPGCGFLQFKLNLKNNIPADWASIARDVLNNIESSRIHAELKNKLLQQVGLDKILGEGIRALNDETIDLNKFMHQKFDIKNENISLSKSQTEMLIQDFMKLTNTIEIRQISTVKNTNLLKNHALNNDDYIGFLHSGSIQFPNILKDEFIFPICEFADTNKLFSLDEIEKGIVGVSLHSILGKKYEAWIYAAMNYALVSRYALFQSIKEELEFSLPCEVTMINDNIHAGLFRKMLGKKEIVYSVRGVQAITKNQLSLIAGQRETPAALVSGGMNSEHYGNFLSHGTGYHIVDNFNYDNEFNVSERQSYLQDAKFAHFNSKPKHEQCIPFTYNLCKSLEHFERIGLTKSVAFLRPIINIQSDWIKDLH